MRQKLVSVYLIDYTWDKDGEAKAEDTGVAELLTEYLDDDWRVVQMMPLSGAGGGSEIAGWIIVLLEKPEDTPELPAD